MTRQELERGGVRKVRCGPEAAVARFVLPRELGETALQQFRRRGGAGRGVRGLDAREGFPQRIGLRFDRVAPVAGDGGGLARGVGGGREGGARGAGARNMWSGRPRGRLARIWCAVW